MCTIFGAENSNAWKCILFTELKTMIIVHACTMIIVHACSMVIVHACTMIIIHVCTVIIVHVSCPAWLMIDAMRDWGGASPPNL